jgi:hypothetical protein
MKAQKLHQLGMHGDDENAGQKLGFFMSSKSVLSCPCPDANTNKVFNGVYVLD